MFLTVHAPASLLISKRFKNSLLIFILALISHYLLDLFPHDPIDMTTGRDFIISGIIDLFFVAILLFSLWRLKKIKINKRIIIGIAGAFLPDFLTGLHILFPNINILQQIASFNHFVHTVLFGRFIALPGWQWLPLQLSVFIICLYFFLKKK
jgi:hypothetical protein